MQGTVLVILSESKAVSIHCKTGFGAKFTSSNNKTFPFE